MSTANSVGVFESLESSEMELIENPKKNRGTVPTVKSPLIKTKRGNSGGTWALAIKRKILPDGDDWNTATPAQLEKRTGYEQDLVKLLRLGCIRNYDHLKEMVAKL